MTEALKGERRKMKTKTKIGLTTIVPMILLLLFSGVSIVYAGTNTRGGDRTGDPNAVSEYHETQEDYPQATELHFTSCQSDADIKGWSITISKFSSSSSTRDGNQRVDVEAWGYTVMKDEEVEIDVSHWTSGCWNAMGLADVYWVEGSEAKPHPDHLWRVDFPVAQPGQPGNYKHLFNMTNLDNDCQLKISGFTFLYTMIWHEELSGISFTGPSYDFTLPTEGSWTIDIITPGRFVRGYIYFKYDIYNLDGSKVVCNAWGGHRVTSPVGGIWVPVDKLGLMAPYIALAIAVVAVALGAVSARKRWLGKAVLPKP